MTKEWLQRPAVFCPTTPNEIKKRKLQCNTEPPLCFIHIVMARFFRHSILLSRMGKAIPVESVNSVEPKNRVLKSLNILSNVRLSPNVRTSIILQAISPRIKINVKVVPVYKTFLTLSAVHNLLFNETKIIVASNVGIIIFGKVNRVKQAKY